MTISEMLQQSCRAMHMEESAVNPYGCGTCLTGNSVHTKGSFWYLVHDEDFAVTICDFSFLRDTPMKMPESMLYLALRLDYASHLFPGKIMGFLEEKGGGIETVMPAGRRVAYTEVMYVPAFYGSRLRDTFTGTGHDPIDVLKSMGREHNWSPEMVRVLTEICKSDLKGLSGEFYYVAKSYELMAELIAMGNRRLPQSPADYDDISRVITYIEEHFTESPRQDNLVRLSHMSPTKLKKLFRQFTGSTITDYVLSRKTDLAEHLLSETALSIEEIAAQTGFATATGFATSFKKHAGMTPTEYRKRMGFNYMNNPSEIDDLEI